MTNPLTHASAPAFANRLKRAWGLWRRVMRMIEDRQICLDIAMPSHAIKRAFANAGYSLGQSFSTLASRP